MFKRWSLGGGLLLGGLVLLLTPGTGKAQVYTVPVGKVPNLSNTAGPFLYGSNLPAAGQSLPYTGIPRYRVTPVFNDAPPSYYASVTSVGQPTYMSSINYPWMYGAYTYGTAFPGVYLSSALPTPYTLYPVTTYSPVSPPTAAAFARYAEPPAPSEGSVLSTSGTGPATITINVPSDAEVTVQGKKLDQIGTNRNFVSPFLSPNQAYSYDVKATWQENGTEVSRTERLIVRAGDQKSVTFIGQSSLRTRPRATEADYLRPRQTPSESVYPRPRQTDSR